MSDEQRFWEPFVPQVGQRVRVRISPECETHSLSTLAQLIDTVNGRTGVVATWPQWVKGIIGGIADDHPYLVSLEEPIGGKRCFAVCAAIELEGINDVSE